jgi:hypothetical protein
VAAIRAVAPAGPLGPGGRYWVGSPPGGCGGGAAAAGTFTPDGCPDGGGIGAPGPPSMPGPSSGRSGGEGMPGARVNFGDDDSPGTVARPTAARPAAVDAPSAASGSAGVVGAPEAPDFACVSVIN